MVQFNLDTWLQDKSRKVVTRNGKPVRIVCTDSPDEVFPIVGFVENEITTRMWQATGEYNNIPDCVYDLFFADEEEKPQSIEIPFGAKDSEFVRDEYYIPKGCEARIEGNKVIIEKIQKDELTEFEKELQIIISEASHWTSDDGSMSTYCQFGDKEIKKISVQILDLAKKEILKDLPKWKRNKPNEKYIHNKGYYLTWNELEKLPKEE